MEFGLPNWSIIVLLKSNLLTWKQLLHDFPNVENLKNKNC